MSGLVDMLRFRSGLLLVLLLMAAAGCSSRGEPAVSTAQDYERIVHAPQQAAVLDQGFDSLVQRIALIRAAQSRIDVQTFIYVDDASGRLIMDELAAAADRGVRVRVLIDAMFCSIPPARLARLRHDHPGLALAVYNPRPKEVVEARRALQEEVTAGLNHRMHNKLLVVDGLSGITGGRNHEDAYFDIGQGLNYRDREILIRGASARQMAACAAAWWFHPLVVQVDELVALQPGLPLVTPDAAAVASEQELVQRVARVRAAVDHQLAAGAVPQWRPVSAAAFCWDVPGRNQDAEASSTVAGLAEVLRASTSRIQIASPYCVLTSGSLDNLSALRERGVQVDILTNSLASTDAWWAFGGYLRDRRRLIAAGVVVDESRPLPADAAHMWSTAPEVVALRSGGREPFLSLHAKCILADERVTVIGTFNLDPRSKHINTEQVLILWDAGVASDLAALLRQDAAPQNAWRVGLRDMTMGWFHAPFIRLSEWTGDSLSVDIYPVQPTSCFDLRPGGQPVPYGHPDFIGNWIEVGPTPDADEATARRAAAVQAFGAAFTPLL